MKPSELFSSNIELLAGKNSPLGTQIIDQIVAIELDDSDNLVFLDKRVANVGYSRLSGSSHAEEVSLFTYQKLRYEFQLNDDIRSGSGSTSHLEPLGENASILSLCLPEVTESKISTFTSIIAHGISALVHICSSSSYISTTTTHVICICTDLSELALGLQFYSLTELIAGLKERAISLSFIINTDLLIANIDVFTSLVRFSPVILSRSLFVQANIFHESNQVVRSWFTEPEMLKSELGYYYGDSSDELNQYVQALENLSFHKLSSTSRSTYIYPECVPLSSRKTAFVLASGPSLDHSIHVLKSLLDTKPDDVTTIVAGSSLGTALANNIIPDYLVIIERDRQIYDDYSALPPEILDSVTLVASSTVDPRLSRLFANVIFFQKPLGAAQCIAPDIYGSSGFLLPGPECINAALEFALRCQHSSIYLFGADFGAPDPDLNRSRTALGSTPRSLTLPESSRDNQTIWTSPELIIVRNSLNSLLRLEHKSMVYFVGTGLRVDNSSYVAPELFVEHLRDSTFNISPENLISSKVTSSFNQAPEALKLIQASLVSRSLQKISEDFTLLLSHSTEWNQSLHKSLLPLLTFEEGSIDPAEAAARRILRQYISTLMSRWILDPNRVTSEYVRCLQHVTNYTAKVLMLAEKIILNSSSCRDLQPSVSLVDQILVHPEYFQFNGSDQTHYMLASKN